MFLRETNHEAADSKETIRIPPPRKPELVSAQNKKKKKEPGCLWSESPRDLKGSLRWLVLQPWGNWEFWEREGSFLSFTILEAISLHEIFQILIKTGSQTWMSP